MERSQPCLYEKQQSVHFPYGDGLVSKMLCLEMEGIFCLRQCRRFSYMKAKVDLMLNWVGVSLGLAGAR